MSDTNEGAEIAGGASPSADTDGMSSAQPAAAGGASEASGTQSGDWSSLDAALGDSAGLSESGRGGTDEGRGAPQGATMAPLGAGAPQGATMRPTEAAAAAGVMAQNTGRTFDGLNPEDIPHLRQMSNSAYSYVYPLLKGIRQGEYIPKAEVDKMKLSLRGWNTPEGYVFNPQFTQLSETVEAQTEYGNYLIRALEYADGDAVDHLVFDEKGQLHNLGKVVMSPGIRARFQQALANSDNQLAKHKAAIDSLRDNHLKSVEEYTSQITSIQDQITAGFGQHPEFQKKYKEALENVIPPAMQSDPASQLTASLLVMTQILAKNNNQLQQELTKFRNFTAGSTSIPNSTLGGNPNSSGAAAGWSKIDQMLG